MKIKCLTTFLDGTRRFEMGDDVTVPDADGARFCGHGWAQQVGGEAAAPAAGDVTLQVHGTASSTGDSNG